MRRKSISHGRLLDLVPPQNLVTRRWLLSQGVNRHTADNWVKRGRLVVLRPGVYANPGLPLTWESVVRSLQRMGYDLTVGGLTSLELQGCSHYIPLARDYSVDLYGQDPLPRWINALDVRARFCRFSTAWLQAGEGPQVSDDPYGFQYPFVVQFERVDGLARLRVSTIERAFLEVLSGVPKQVSFEHAELLLDGLYELLPRRLNSILARTRSVKVKRLFFWLAKRQGHSWLKYVPEDGIDFGSGKRQLERGGRLNKEYQITVPADMAGGTREFL